MIKLFGFPLSQPTRSVILLCLENQLPYELVKVDARKGDTRKPEFRKIVPSGYVPAIVDQENDIVLSEAGAILQYLCEKNKLTHWYPPSDSSKDKDSIVARARINFWLHWNHTNTRSSTKQILIKKFYPPKDQPLEQALNAGRKEFSRSVSFIENTLQNQGTKFLCGNSNPSIADLIILPELDQLSTRAFDLFDYSPFPKVRDWMNTMEQALPSYSQVFAKVIEEAEIYKKKN